MTSAAIRERLYDFIRVADEKKVKAIYTILEAEVEETVEWWKNKSYTTEMDQRFKDWKSGKSAGSTLEDISHRIAQAKPGNIK